MRNNSCYHVEDHTSDSTALWVRLCPTASQAPILAGVCYPPQPDPHSYNSTAYLTNWAAWPTQCLPAQACRSSWLATSLEVPQTAGDGRCSKCAQPPAFRSAQGRLPATRQPSPTLANYQPRTRPTRFDHILENVAAMPMLSNVVVSQHWRGLIPQAFGGAADSGPALPAAAALRWTAHSV